MLVQKYAFQVSCGGCVYCLKNFGVLFQFLWIDFEFVWFRFNKTTIFQFNIRAKRRERLQSLVMLKRKNILSRKRLTSPMELTTTNLYRCLLPSQRNGIGGVTLLICIWKFHSKLQMYLTFATFRSVISLFVKLLYLLKCEHSTRIQKNYSPYC